MQPSPRVMLPQEQFAEIARNQDESGESSPRCDVCVCKLESRHVQTQRVGAHERQLCDLCGEFVPAACICRMDGLIDLCPECFQHMVMMPEGQVKSSIKRILIGNVL